MKYHLLLCIVGLISCEYQADKSSISEHERLQKEITLLNRKVDSLITALNPPGPIIDKMAKTIKKKKPGTSNSQSTGQAVYNSKSYTSKSSSSFDGQCHGITKKGARCRRSVSSGMYCWQHWLAIYLTTGVIYTNKLKLILDGKCNQIHDNGRSWPSRSNQENLDWEKKIMLLSTLPGDK